MRTFFQFLRYRRTWHNARGDLFILDNLRGLRKRASLG